MIGRLYTICKTKSVTSDISGLLEGRLDINLKEFFVSSIFLNEFIFDRFDDEVEGDDEMRNEDVEADEDDDDSSDSSDYVTSEDDGSEDSDYDPYDMYLVLCLYRFM